MVASGTDSKAALSYCKTIPCQKVQLARHVQAHTPITPLPSHSPSIKLALNVYAHTPFLAAGSPPSVNTLSLLTSPAPCPSQPSPCSGTSAQNTKGRGRPFAVAVTRRSRQEWLPGPGRSPTVRWVGVPMGEGEMTVTELREWVGVYYI